MYLQIKKGKKQDSAREPLSTTCDGTLAEAGRKKPERTQPKKGECFKELSDQGTELQGQRA